VHGIYKKGHRSWSDNTRGIHPFTPHAPAAPVLMLFSKFSLNRLVREKMSSARHTGALCFLLLVDRDRDTEIVKRKQSSPGMCRSRAAATKFPITVSGMNFKLLCRRNFLCPVPRASREDDSEDQHRRAETHKLESHVGTLKVGFFLEKETHSHSLFIEITDGKLWICP